VPNYSGDKQVILLDPEKKAVKSALALEIVTEMVLEAIELNPRLPPVLVTCSASIFCVNTNQTTLCGRM
jgi:hypothetical protein